MTCAISTPSPQRMNYVFVDYENVQDIDLDLVAGKPMKVFLVAGPKSKFSAKLASQLERHRGQASLILSDVTGNNALDRVLVFNLGRQVEADPAGHFHIVAKDKGYDPLKKHLGAKGVHLRRTEAFSKLPLLARPISPPIDPTAMSLQTRIELAVEHLRRVAGCRPAKRRTLVTSLDSVFQKKLETPDVDRVIDALVEKKLLKVLASSALEYQF